MRRHSPHLLVAAVVLLALSLRLSVNAVGAVLPQIRADLGLSATTAGLLNALPEIVFALVGIATPALAARLGRQRLIALALIIALFGQLLRALQDTTTTLFAGTLLSLVGPAVGNVLLPGVIREHFPRRVNAMTAVYVTVLSLGAALGSGVTIPLQHAVDGSWRAGMLAWAGVAAIAVVPWLLVARRGHDRRVDRQPAVRVRGMMRSRLAWSLAGFFALQAAQVYVVLGWFGQVLQDAGIGEVETGALLAMAPLIGIGLSLCVPMLLGRPGRVRTLAVGFGSCYVIGYVGLLVAPAQAAVLWMVFVGLGGGTFPMALTLVAMRGTTTDEVVALSAFTQCIGYLLGSLGPLAFGLLHDLTGSWWPSMLMMLVSLVPMVRIGARLNDGGQLPEQIDLVVEPRAGRWPAAMRVVPAGCDAVVDAALDV